MNNILILDTETTGLDAQKNQVIEVAAILYNLPNQGIVSQCSVLIPCQTNAAQKINHIEPKLTQTVNQEDLKWGIGMIERMAARSDVILAHNAKFDRAFSSQALSIDKPWVCTASEIQWPGLMGWPKLKDLCLKLGVLYEDAHRGLPDCQVLLKCLLKLNNLKEQLEGLLKSYPFRVRDKSACK
jgi:DNA polymerase III subunit epsilon